MMVMNDEKLCAEVARVWVDGGGDEEGLDWCHQKLKAAVRLLIAQRNKDILEGDDA